MESAQAATPQLANAIADAGRANAMSPARDVRSLANHPQGLRGGLIPLFVSYAALQALDVHSTLTVVNHGGFERNPIVAPLVNHPAAFVAYKAGLTTATFLVANRVSKRSRVAAYVLLGVMDTAYAFVVAHNYQVAAQLR